MECVWEGSGWVECHNRYWGHQSAVSLQMLRRSRSVSSGAREDTDDFLKVSSQPVCLCLQIDAERSPDEVFAQICQAMESCSTFWFPQHRSHPKLFCPGGPPVKTFSLCHITRRRLTYTLMTPTPAPNTCSLNCSGSHVPPDVLKHSQHSVKALSPLLTLMKRLVVTFCFTCIVSLLHRLQYMLPTARMRQITVLRK